MNIDYFDRINKEKITIKTNARVVHYMQGEKEKFRKLRPEEVTELSKTKRDEYFQRQFEREHLSLDKLMLNGYQPSYSCDFIEEISREERERRYFNSAEYKRFRRNLRNEIRKTFDIMPPEIRKIMFLRFFKEMSIGQIARELGIQKSTVQTQLSRGTKYIKYFLDKDIKEQDKIEKERKMKREQARQLKRK